MRIVQLQHPSRGRRIALVSEPNLQLIESIESTYALVERAIIENTSLGSLIQTFTVNEILAYDPIYKGHSEWRILPCMDHPADPQNCMLSGTGLTHKASAENRQKMHDAATSENITDSMLMYQMGVDGGKPEDGKIGVQPEWFYKGNGSVLKGHLEKLIVPNYADDGGEEPEIAGIYYCDQQGIPHRVGFATANEFSDHVMEKKNYLYLAPSKIRHCAIGPELVLDSDFTSVSGKVQITRSGETIWEKPISTGEENMAHTLSNLEYHHFKYENHRQPGMVHIHFFGADAFSYGENVLLQDGDEMEVSWSGMGRALKNTLSIENKHPDFFKVEAL